MAPKHLRTGEDSESGKLGWNDSASRSNADGDQGVCLQARVCLDGALDFSAGNLLIEDGHGLLRDFQWRELNCLVLAEAVEVCNGKVSEKS